jgi:hypothetical protein
MREAVDSFPLPVLRERVRERVHFENQHPALSTEKNPLPCPLPEYREREEGL